MKVQNLQSNIINIDKYSSYICLNEYLKNLLVPMLLKLGVKNPAGGEAGCYASHLEIIKECYHKGNRRILIFEDDAIPTNSCSSKKMSECINFMKSNEDWDLFFLGYLHNFHKLLVSKMKKQSGNIIKINGFGASSYCINRKFMKYMLKTHPVYKGVAFDMAFYNKGKQYSIYPMIFRQNTKLKSDIAHTDLGKMDAILSKVVNKIDHKVHLNGIFEKINHNYKFLILLMIIYVIIIKLK